MSTNEARRPMLERWNKNRGRWNFSDQSYFVWEKWTEMKMRRKEKAKKREKKEGGDKWREIEKMRKKKEVDAKGWELLYVSHGMRVRFCLMTIWLLYWMWELWNRKRAKVIVHIIVLNCQQCNQCIKCQVSGHKNCHQKFS